MADRFYCFDQNNSGGHLAGPALYVIIEAPDADAANARAEQLGLYFDGCQQGWDCSCCGDRWDRVYGKGDPSPMIYGEPVEEFVSNYSKSGEVYAIYYAGTDEPVLAPAKERK